MQTTAPRYRQLLTQYLRPHLLWVLLLTLLLFSDIGLQLAAPQVVRTFIDAAMAGETLRDLLLLAALFLAVTLVQQGVSIAAAYVGDNVAWRATNQLRTDLFHHCLRLEMPFHHRHTPGAMIERIDGDVSVLSNFFSRFALLVIGNLLLLFGVLALLYREDWRLGLLFSVFTAVAFLTFRAVEGKVAPYWQKALNASAEIYGFIEERLGGLDDIRANGAIPATMRYFYQTQQRFFQSSQRARYFAFVIGSTVDLVFSVGTVAALALGVYLYQRELLSLGGVYLITQYSQLILRPINVLGDQVDDLQRVGASVARINELWQDQTTLSDGGQIVQSTDAAAVVFEQVTFRYEQSVTNDIKSNQTETPAAVLHDISFTLEAGRVLGLLGRTGSGKSTLIRLLFRLYDPTAGVIRLNSMPLPALQITDLRRQIGLVTQDVQLFDGTLRDNLTFFNRTVPDEKLIEAFRLLGLAEWLEQLPAGLATHLGAGGQGISAGEAQLIALVRVFLKDPTVVILDEASSRLDPATERLIEGAVNQLLTGATGPRTSIIIAHRLRTIQRVDDILILDGGRIREHGERSTLAADANSYYAQLLATDTAADNLDEVLS